MEDGARRRRGVILQELRRQGTMRVVDIAAMAEVSVETVRRDLTALADQGLVNRSYGVAEALETGTFEADLAARETHHAEVKELIARETARHLGDAATVFLDEGFTAGLIARALPVDRRLTVVTASAPIASALAANPAHNVFLTGGRVRGATLACVDDWAVNMVRAHAFDLAILGAHGISRTDGLTTPDPAVGAVKRAAIDSARRTVFFGLHTKFGVTSFSRFARVQDLDLIVTDRSVSATEAHRYRALGPEVVRV